LRGAGMAVEKWGRVGYGGVRLRGAVPVLGIFALTQEDAVPGW
jgi:hypothetical protein